MPRYSVSNSAVVLALPSGEALKIHSHPAYRERDFFFSEPFYKLDKAELHDPPEISGNNIYRVRQNIEKSIGRYRHLRFASSLPRTRQSPRIYYPLSVKVQHDGFKSVPRALV